MRACEKMADRELFPGEGIEFWEEHFRKYYPQKNREHTYDKGFAQKLLQKLFALCSQYFAHAHFHRPHRRQSHGKIHKVYASDQQDDQRDGRKKIGGCESAIAANSGIEVNVSDSLEAKRERIITFLNVSLDGRREILPTKLVQFLLGLFRRYIGLDLNKKRAIPSIPIVQNAGIVYDDGEIVEMNENIELDGRIEGNILCHTSYLIVFACLAKGECQHLSHGILFAKIFIGNGASQNNAMRIG